MLGFTPIATRPLGASPQADGRKLIAEAAAFALAGQDATLEIVTGLSIAADAAALTLTGQDATLEVTAELSIAADTGAFALAGQDAELTLSYRLPAEVGAFAVVGQDADLSIVIMRSIEADTGVFAAAGQVAMIDQARVLRAGTGAFVITGQDTAISETVVQLDDTRIPTGYTLSGDEITATNTSGGDDYRQWVPAEKPLIPSSTETAYWEVLIQTTATGDSTSYISVEPVAELDGSNGYDSGVNPGQGVGTMAYRGDGYLWAAGSIQRIDLTPFEDGDVLMFAFEPAGSKLWVGVNGVWDRDPDLDSPSISYASYDDPAGWVPVIQGRGDGDGATLRSAAGQFSYPIPAVAVAYVDVAVPLERSLTAEAAAFALTGPDADIVQAAARFLPVDTGAVELVGQDVPLRVDRDGMPADAGTLTLAGQPVDLTIDRVITAQPGAIVLAGAGDLLTGRVLQAATAPLDLEGAQAGVTAVRTMHAGSGSFGAAGAEADLRYSPLFSADNGSFDVVGADAEVRTARVIPVEAAAIEIDTTEAQLGAQGRVQAQVGGFDVGGTATLRAERTLAGEPYQSSIVPSPAGVIASRIVVADIRGLNVTLSPAGFPTERILHAQSIVIHWGGIGALLDWPAGNASRRRVATLLQPGVDRKHDPVYTGATLGKSGNTGTVAPSSNSGDLDA